jgi:hypothetical protein
MKWTFILSENQWVDKSLIIDLFFKTKIPEYYPIIEG